MKRNSAAAVAELRRRAAELVAAEPTPKNNDDYGDLFRQMCEIIYGKPVEQLTYEELVNVQRALQEPTPQPVYDLDLEMQDSGLPAQSVKARVPTAKELALGLGLALAPAAPSSESPVEIEQPAKAPTGWEHYEELVTAAASAHSVPEDVLRAMLSTENDVGNPNAVNPDSGAVGLGQFMPGTAEELGIDPRDPAQAIDAAAKYLSQMEKEFGNWPDALRAYNWGPGNVRRWLASGAPPEKLPAETREYVQKIMPGVESSLSRWLSRS